MKRKSANDANEVYAVLCRRTDCGDTEVFLLDDRHFDTRRDARRAMREDYRAMREQWGDCEGRSSSDEYALKVPVWNAEEEKDDWIVCRWRVVET